MSLKKKRGKILKRKSHDNSTLCRREKRCGEEYCDFIIGFNSGNYEMAEVVEPKPTIMRRPLRKSVSEGVMLSDVVH